MSRLGHLTSELRHYPLATSLSRLVDDRPIQCTLYVTDRCNLDCAYCAEFDNSVPHPNLDDLKARIRMIRELGALRVALVGGEPLLHPEIVEVVRFCRSEGLATSLTTNGFLLSADLVHELEAAGLQVMQISVDRMTPTRSLPKSFRTVLPKLGLFRDSRIRVHISTVVSAESIEQTREVVDTALAHGIPCGIGLVHADPAARYRVDRGDDDELVELIEELRARRRAGEAIHTHDQLLQYQLARVRGKSFDWTCAAGFKIFFVSARGTFWQCSMVRDEIPLEQVRAEDLRGYYRRKSCQKDCGVYCAVTASLLHERPLRMFGNEVATRVRRIAAGRRTPPGKPPGQPTR